MKKYILIISVFFATGIAGCKKDYLSQEINPNSPSVTTPQLTLAGALNTSSQIVVGSYSQYGVWMGYWTTSGNYVPSTTINEFQFTNSNFNGDWNSWYANLTNYNNLYNTAKADASLANFQAIAMIMKAYGFQHLVDQFNDVPYTQAFQPSTILFPAYDKGSDIYEDLGKQLDAAIALIQKSGATATNPGVADIAFGGVMNSWIKFANSVKLRLAIRVSTKTPGDPLVTDLASTASLGYIDGTTEATVNPGYSNTDGKQNPFYGDYGYDQNGNPTGSNLYYRAGASCVDTLQKYADPRTTQIYALTLPPGAPATVPNSIVRGNNFGDPKALPNSNTSTFGPGLLASPTQNAYLMLGSESLFLQSEATQKGFINTGKTAQQLYEAAITASFVELGLTATAAPAYYTKATPYISWTTSLTAPGGVLKAIIIQKWIAMNSLFNFEAYNEYRRTGYPTPPVSLDPASISNTIPTRMYYPLSELQTNAANLAKEGTIDPFSTKIFWAQ